MCKIIKLFYIVLLMVFSSCYNDNEEVMEESFHPNNAELPVDMQNENITAEDYYGIIFQSSRLGASDKSRVIDYMRDLTVCLKKWYLPLFDLLKRQKISSIYIDSTQLSEGFYNPVTNCIVFKNSAAISENRVVEELLHSGQNRVYPEGIEKYAAAAGLPNIEFEVRFFRDLVNCVNHSYVGYGVGKDNYDEYQEWIMELCDGYSEKPKFPSIAIILDTKVDKDGVGMGYFEMIDAFRQAYPKYNKRILTDLDPEYVGYIYCHVKHDAF